jgi:hypothetical protein
MLLPGGQDLNLRILSDPNRALYQAELPPVAALFNRHRFPSLPTELLGGADAVTIGAANFAFLYLREDPRPRECLSRHRAHFGVLRAPHVIEFKHDRVGVPAIHAPMFREIIVEQLPITDHVFALVLSTTAVMGLSVPLIVVLAVCPLTRITIRAWVRVSGFSTREFCGRFGHPAGRTTFDDDRAYWRQKRQFQMFHARYSRAPVRLSRSMERVKREVFCSFLGYDQPSIVRSVRTARPRCDTACFNSAGSCANVWPYGG